MKHTGGRPEVNAGKIVIFGAGKIGRSFIGQLFGRSGYQVVFVDVDPLVISLLNERNSYRIVIKGEHEEEIIIGNVSAVSAADRQNAVAEISSAGILAVSVGKNALTKVIPLLAAGLEARFSYNPDIPLDIILAENMRSASEFTRALLVRNLPPDFPVDSYVGLIETSIGKMVPIMPIAEVEKDPLVVFAEPYNTLILDAKGFRSPIPDIEGLAPKNNIKAWVDRKAFIHNLGHATAAYYGFYLHPEAVYMFEVLEDGKVRQFTRNVMLQSAETLLKAYPSEFSPEDIVEHIDDLLKRFTNKALLDTVYRVGHDLNRKLGPDDRFMGAIRLALAFDMPYNLVIKAMSYGFCFRASDEEGNFFASDISFMSALSENFESALSGILMIDSPADEFLIRLLKEQYLTVSRS